MKTITTKRGIEVDVYINSFHNFNTTTTLEVTAVVENGEKDFTLELSNQYGNCNVENIEDFFNDADTSLLEVWADAIELAFLSGELQKWCVLQAEIGKYYSFSMFTFNAVNVVINGIESDRLAINGKQFYHEQLSGVKQIKEFLNIA